MTLNFLVAFLVAQGNFTAFSQKRLSTLEQCLYLDLRKNNAFLKEILHLPRLQVGVNNIHVRKIRTLVAIFIERFY